jgi:hypothetical protein
MYYISEFKTNINMFTNQLITDPTQAEKFIRVIEAIYKVPREQAEGIYLAERDFFTQALDNDTKLASCELTSIMNVFLDVLTHELTFSPALKLIYMEPRWTAIKTHPQGGETRLAWKPSPFGKVYLCQRAGSISHVTQPELVFEGDVYISKVVDNVKFISHEKRGTAGKALLCYCFIHLPSGAIEAFELPLDEMLRLKKYNPKNGLYTSNNGEPDHGFFKSKTVGHAVKYKRAAPIRSAYLITPDAQVEEQSASMGMYVPPLPPAPVQMHAVPGGFNHNPAGVEQAPPMPPTPVFDQQQQYQQQPQYIPPVYAPDPNQYQQPPVYVQQPAPQYMPATPVFDQQPQLPGLPGIPASAPGDAF